MTGDDELRQLLSDATGSPRLTARDELLESLLSRIDAGGEDVADAPLPRPMLEAVPARTTAARIASRAAGIGVAGWAAIAVATAAAATAGALLVLQPSPDAPPQLPPSTVVSTTPSVEDAHLTPSAPSVSLSPENLELPGVDITAPALPEPLGLDPGGIVDTVAPVVSALDASSLTSGVLDLVGCTGTAPVAATASDAHGVTSATLSITIAGSDGARHAMTPVGDGRWVADVGPFAVASLGSVTGSATVRVEVRDAAGNIGARDATVPLSALLCLG
jgi:hypothetical protein